MPRSGGQVPRPATTLLPLRSRHGGRATAQAPLSSAGLSSLSGHRKQTAAQAGPGLFLLLKEAATSSVPARPRDTGRRQPLGKGLCGKARLFVPPVKITLEKIKRTNMILSFLFLVCDSR